MGFMSGPYTESVSSLLGSGKLAPWIGNAISAYTTSLTVSGVNQLIDAGSIDPSTMMRQGAYTVLGATAGKAVGMGVSLVGSYSKWSADGLFLKPGSQKLYSSGSLQHGTWGTSYQPGWFSAGTNWVDPIFGNIPDTVLNGIYGVGK
jgi:hypothetical protein